MQMTHPMRVVESEDWSIEQEGMNEYHIRKFSPTGQDFSIIVRDTMHCKDEIYRLYQALNKTPSD